jgi:hypothetical protein
MELNTANPIEMAFSTHNKVTVGHGPQLPGSIVGAGGNDVFLRVIGKGSYSHQVALESLLV